MFTSRPSDPRTVLLWGDRWWFAGTGASCGFGNLAHAAEILAAHYAQEPKPVRLRLIYQPDAFDSVAVACPLGDRATLAAALGGDFPALGKPDHVWSHEPVMAKDDGHSTVLHFETEPGLFALAAHLAQFGLAVDSAWPLATFLHALPDEWTDSGAVTVVALESARAAAYRHPNDGGRTVQMWHGDATIAEVGQWLGEILAENAEEPVLVVSADDECAVKLESYVGEGDRPGLEWVLLAEALARPVVLPRYHPAQLLPRIPKVTAQPAVIAASIALLLAAGWAGLTFGRASFAARAEMASRQSRLRALHAEVAHLRENTAEIAALRSLLDGGAAGPPCGIFLQNVSRTLPPEIVLSSVRIAGRTIELDGWVAPQASTNLLEEWRTRLAPTSAVWTATIRSGGGGAFTLTGAFQL